MCVALTLGVRFPQIGYQVINVNFSRYMIVIRLVNRIKQMSTSKITRLSYEHKFFYFFVFRFVCSPVNSD